MIHYQIDFKHMKDSLGLILLLLYSIRTAISSTLDHVSTKSNGTTTNIGALYVLPIIFGSSDMLI